MLKMTDRKKIKILQCIRQGQIGGGESHLLSLVENLDRERYEPIVLSFTPGPMVDRLKEMGIETHVIYTERPFDVTKWNKVKQFLKDHQIEIVHAHGTRAASNLLWAARSLRIPLIYTIHGWSFHPDQHPVVQKLRILGEKYLTSKSSLNISVSKSNQQTGKDFFSSFDSVVVNNGINLTKFNPINIYPDIKKELNIPTGKILLLFIARFTLHKQPLTLIKAFAKAVQLNPNLHLLMVGDGDQKNTAIGLLDELNIKHHVTLEKFRQDVPAVLAAADIFILPSLWEGLPIGLLEAMAMGKAIIASNVDGTKEILENNVNGILVDTNQLEENLSNAIVNLANDEPLKRKMQKNATKTISDRFNAATMTKEIESHYLSILKSRNFN
jgi:glycosyltransferase involved in cell wall biosynthesis